MFELTRARLESAPAKRHSEKEKTQSAGQREGMQRRRKAIETWDRFSRREEKRKSVKRKIN